MLDDEPYLGNHDVAPGRSAGSPRKARERWMARGGLRSDRDGRSEIDRHGKPHSFWLAPTISDSEIVGSAGEDIDYPR